MKKVFFSFLFILTSCAGSIACSTVSKSNKLVETWYNCSHSFNVDSFNYSVYEGYHIEYDEYGYSTTIYNEKTFTVPYKNVYLVVSENYEYKNILKVYDEGYKFIVYVKGI